MLTAFANTKGGKILFGVSDDAIIEGIKKEDLDEIDKFLTDICASKTRPSVNIEKNFVEINNKIIGIFEVKKSDKIIQNLYDKHYYIRKGSTNRIFMPDEISEFNSRKGSW